MLFVFFLCLVRSKGLAPPVAPRATCLRWVAMYCVAMQLWVCAESNCLCKHKVTLNTHPQSTIARTSLPFSVPSRLLRTFESLVVHPRKFVRQSISVCSRSADRSSSPSLTNNWLIGYNNTKNAGVSPHLISVFRFRDVLFVLVVNDYHLLTTPSTSQFFLSSFKFDYNIIVSYFTVKLFFWIKLSR